MSRSLCREAPGPGAHSWCFSSARAYRRGVPRLVPASPFLSQDISRKSRIISRREEFFEYFRTEGLGFAGNAQLFHRLVAQRCPPSSPSCFSSSSSSASSSSAPPSCLSSFSSPPPECFARCLPFALAPSPPAPTRPRPGDSFGMPRDIAENFR